VKSGRKFRMPKPRSVLRGREEGKRGWFTAVRQMGLRGRL
jgi:hypothetical protein